MPRTRTRTRSCAAVAAQELRRIPHPRHGDRRSRLRRALQVLRRLAGALTAPFVIDLGFSRNDYAAIVKGVGLAATLIGSPAEHWRAPIRWSRPVDRRFPQMASNLVFTWQALVGVNLWALTLTIIVEFHRRDRNGDLHRLPVRRYATTRCTPRRNTRCSPRSPRSGGLTFLAGAGCRRARRLALFFVRCTDGTAEPRAANLAATARDTLTS